MFTREIKDETVKKQPDDVQTRHRAADLAIEITPPEKIRLQVPEHSQTQPNHQPHLVPHRQPIHLERHSETKQFD